MLFVSRLSLLEQADCLVASLAEHGVTLDRLPAQQLCLSLAGREEKAAAKWLRGELARAHIRVKHAHALRLIGLLSGRGGWHGAPAPEPRYELGLVGLTTPEGSDVRTADGERLLALMCDALSGWAAQVSQPKLARLYRGSNELLIEQDPMQGGFLARFTYRSDADFDRWLKLQNHAVERIRRALIEGHAPVFLDGLALAFLPCDGEHGARDIGVYGGESWELGRGSDLRVLELLEAKAGDALLSAVADCNTIRAGERSYPLTDEYRVLEPRIATRSSSLFQPQTEMLLRQYRLIRRKTGKTLRELALDRGRMHVPDGIPRTVPVDWEAVKAEMVKRSLSIAELIERSGSTALYEAWMKKPGEVELDTFVQTAKAVQVVDLNTLVRKPVWSQAVDAAEPALRSVLHGVDELRFVVSPSFETNANTALREACEELNASRRLRHMQAMGNIAPPLDEVVYSVDAQEFLAAAGHFDAEVRMQVTTLFVPVPKVGGIPAEFADLPAVGRRLTLFLQPRESTPA